MTNQSVARNNLAELPAMIAACDARAERFDAQGSHHAAEVQRRIAYNLRSNLDDGITVVIQEEIDSIDELGGEEFAQDRSFVQVVKVLAETAAVSAVGLCAVDGFVNFLQWLAR